MRWGQFLVGRRLKLWVCWMRFVDVWRLAWFGTGKQALSDNSRAALHCAGIPGTQSCNFSIPQGIRFRLNEQLHPNYVHLILNLAHTAGNLPAMLCRTDYTRTRKLNSKHTTPVLFRSQEKEAHHSNRKKSDTVTRLAQAKKQKHIQTPPIMQEARQAPVHDNVTAEANALGNTLMDISSTQQQEQPRSNHDGTFPAWYETWASSSFAVPARNGVV